MASLRSKLARLVANTPADPHEPPKADRGPPLIDDDRSREATLPMSLGETLTPDEARRRRIEALRERVQALASKPSKPQVPIAHHAKEQALASLPFVRVERAEGAVDVRAKVYDVTARHGRVSLESARDAHPEAVATLSLDPRLSSFEATRAIYLDTETTGLSGGTGMLAFLVGCGRFEGGHFIVEQWFLRDPVEEPAMLCALRERIESASAIVSFNGKAFDLPLLRARYVMNRLGAPRSPLHLDLVHVARRVYGERLQERRLVHLERDVLGFVREGDVHGSEIPARYSAFLRRGEAEALVPVIEHNLWDVIAMAALVGELSARVVGGDALGRFEPSDMAGLAKTAFRAGDHGLALSMASEALERGGKLGDRAVVARAGAVVARAHRRAGEHARSIEALHAVLEHAPEDAPTHLELSKLYEHKYRDAFRALEHARRAIGAEKDESLARRLARLEARVRKSSLRLPGIES